MQPWYGRIIIWTLVGSLLLVTHAMRADAGEPMEQIRQTVNDVFTVVSNRPPPPREPEPKIRQGFPHPFVFDERPHRVRAHHCPPRPPPQRQEFVTLFTDLLERSYVTRIDSYNAGPQGVHY